MSNKLFLGFVAILLLLLSFNYFYPSILIEGLMCLGMLVFINVFIYCEIKTSPVVKTSEEELKIQPYIFTKDKQEQAIQWIEGKWPNRQCEVCNHTKWDMENTLFTPITFPPNTAYDLTRSYPSVLLTCKNCGNNKSFNAVKMKVIGSND